MNITTKFAIGSIVYAVHSCKLVCNTSQANTDNVYIVSPHEVKAVTASSGRGFHPLMKRQNMRLDCMKSLVKVTVRQKIVTKLVN